MNAILECRQLVKHYNGFPALSGLDLALPKGKIIGLLGPNGSGKTTFIKIAAGLLTVSAGLLLIDGKEPGIETKAIVSYLPERTYFNPAMRIKDLIEYFVDFYTDFDRDNALGMMQRLGINQMQQLKTLSKGNKEKVQLILVMSRKAKLYLLDEPIGGVDPAARDFILETILKNRPEDSTILLSTHLIYDIESSLDEFIFIKNGLAIMQGSAAAVREEKGKSLDQLFREVFKC